jgi:catechol 2,3-dioxygenase-like lactoylglutathione lyase family enzyme
MNRFSALTIGALACAGWLAQAQPACSQTAADEQGKVIGIAFVGRIVSNLDRSVAFYEALGFSQDPRANPAWRTDKVVEHLYGVSGFTTRMAKMYIKNADSGQRFVVYLREVKGIKRRNLAHHTAWEPGASHFALVVPDADLLWSRLKARGLLRARSWGGRLIAPPGQTRGMIAYITDPDGLDIEIVAQRPAVPAEGGRPARPGLLPGVNHVGLVVLDSRKEKAFYGELLGGRLQTASSPWMSGDFYDAAVGGHGNVLRFFNESFPFAAEGRGLAAPTFRMNFEMVEYRNRRKPVKASSITDIGVGYVGMEVDGLDAFLTRTKAAGAKVVSDGIATMRSGTREVMIRDPDVGGFIELFEEAKK